MSAPVDHGAASMRRLEDDLAAALALLGHAAEELERHAPMDSSGWRLALAINALVDQHRAPDAWRRGVAKPAQECYRGC